MPNYWFPCLFILEKSLWNEEIEKHQQNKLETLQKQIKNLQQQIYDLKQGSNPEMPMV